MTNRIVMIGGGFFAKEALEVAEMNKFEITGVCSPENTLGSNYPNFCTKEEDLYKFMSKFDLGFLGIGAFSSKDILKRKDIINFLESEKIKLAKLISPHAILSKGVEIGFGTYIAHNVVISFDAVVGRNSIVNTSAVIGHNVHIGDNVTISSSVFLGGSVEIENDVLLGAGCVVLPGVKISAGSTIGAGSVIVNNVDANSIVYPNISRAIKINKE